MQIQQVVQAAAIAADELVKVKKKKNKTKQKMKLKK